MPQARADPVEAVVKEKTERSHRCWRVNIVKNLRDQSEISVV